MKKDRDFAQEAKAMDFVIKSLYEERDFWLNQEETEKTKHYLKVLNHFINLYEGY